MGTVLYQVSEYDPKHGIILIEGLIGPKRRFVGYLSIVTLLLYPIVILLLHNLHIFDLNCSGALCSHGSYDQKCSIEPYSDSTQHQHVQIVTGKSKTCSAILKGK